MIKSMINKILNILSDNNISTYLINSTFSETEELYFVKKSIATTRLKNIEKYNITVYRDFEINNIKMRGSANCVVDKCMSDCEIKNHIISSYEAALSTKNSYYDLPEPDKYTANSEELGETYTTNQIALALYKNDTSNLSFINSAEIFVTKRKHKILNSNGIDISFSECIYSGEYVVQSIEPNDVELYQDFSYMSTDTNILTELSNMVNNSLKMVNDKAKATLLNQDNKFENVIIEGSAVYEMFNYFVERCNASMICSKYSDYKLNQPIITTSEPNTHINITLMPKKPYTNEGILLKRTNLISDNILNHYTGNARFSYYLGIEPIGEMSKFVMPCGNNDFSEYKNKTYIRVINFSDFQMDVYSGQFGGEFRLAYYYDGHKEHPVTGGSISGNILDIINSVKFSKSPQKLENFEGPLSILYNN